MKKVTLENYKSDKYYLKIVRATEKILEREMYVAPVRLFIDMGLLNEKDYQSWRKGSVPYLEKVITCNLGKANRILRILRFHSHDLNLKPSITVYKYKKQDLRFSKTGDPNLEQAYSRHFVKLGRKC